MSFKLSLILMLFVQYWTLDLELSMLDDPEAVRLIDKQKKAISAAILHLMR